MRFRQPRFADPREGTIMVAYAITLHAVWAVVLLVSTVRIVPTPLGDLQRVMSQRALGTFFLAVMGCAVLGMFTTKPMAALLLLLPQQSALILSAESSARAILASHYADGVPRPRGFILVDQLPALLAVLGHTWAIYVLHRSRMIHDAAGR